MENNTSPSESVQEPPFYKRKAFIYLAIACIALIATGIAAMFHKNYPGVNLKNLAAELINHDLPPGGDRAVLTLADGKTIVLNEAADGKLGEEAGLVFRKTGNGQLLYEVNDEEAGPYQGFHTITTPRGGTYQITLPDGSKVWLNAESTLKFPVNLADLKEREVELSGEAYLEVTKDAKHPFKVISPRQWIKILGTKLNVSSYRNDSLGKTTLVNGSIHVSTLNKVPGTGVTLKANQQAVVSHGNISVLKVDTTAVLAWKNGWFVFDHEPLESIMKKVSRWYDVDVSYQGIDKHQLFTGKVSRAEHVSAVLKQLESAGGIHFIMEQGKIIAAK